MARRRTLSDDAILDRVRPVFVERGYAVRTRQLAAAVGMTWGAIANRFGSKRALFERAMAAPHAGPGDPADAAAGGEEQLPVMLERLRADLWVRWPLRLQVHLAATTTGVGDASEGAVQALAKLFEARARSGLLRSDVSAQTLARLVAAALTGDVAQRFVARERTLVPDPAFIDGVVRLVCH
jgi:AcrR family transcriptional regulator